MKTRHLIARLATDISPVDRNAVSRLLNRALMLGLAGSTVLLVALCGTGALP
jgi:hypothetical protein